MNLQPAPGAEPPPDPAAAGPVPSQSHIPGSEVDALRSTLPPPARRLVTVVHVGLYQFDHWADTQAPDVIRSVLDAITAEVTASAAESEGIVLSDTQDGLIVVIGSERLMYHHALRGLFCATAIQSRLDTLRAAFRAKGTPFPETQIGLDTGEVVLNLPGLTGGSKRFAGRIFSVASRFRRVAPEGQILMSETTMEQVTSSLPAEWEISRVHTEHPDDAEDSAGLLNDNVFALPPELRGRRVRMGAGVKSQPEQAIFEFSYWRGVRVSGSDAVLPALRVATPQTDGIEFEIEETLPPTGHAEFTFGKYRMIEKLGEGGMGEVWLARDRFGNRVAIKKLLSSLAVSPTQIKRFQREALILSKLTHRNISRIFEVGEVAGISYICMEYVDGVSLAEILHYSKAIADMENESFRSRDTDVSSLIKEVQELRAAGSSPAPASPPAAPPTSASSCRILPLTQTLAIFTRIGEALRYLHEHGILHRDLKPANIMVRSDGEPVILDFGLAKLEVQQDLSLSVAGQIMGTLDYMAPEQARSAKDVDERADIYSMGAILYQLLTAHRHFESVGNLIQDAHALQTHEPVPPRQWNPLIEKDLEIITLKCLHLEAEARYLTVSALIEDIEHYRRGEVISAKPATSLDLITKLIRRNRAVSTVIAVSVLLVLILSGIFILQLKQQVLVARELQEKAESERHAKEEVLQKYREAKTTQDLLALQAEQRDKDTLKLTEALERNQREFLEQRKELDRKSNETTTYKKADVALSLAAHAERMMIDANWDAALRYAQAAVIENATVPEARLALCRAYLSTLDTVRAQKELNYLAAQPGNPAPEADRLRAVIKMTDKLRTLQEPHPTSTREDIVRSLWDSSNLADRFLATRLEPKLNTLLEQYSLHAPAGSYRIKTLKIIKSCRVDFIGMGGTTKLHPSPNKLYLLEKLNDDGKTAILLDEDQQYRYLVPLSATDFSAQTATTDP